GYVVESVPLALFAASRVWSEGFQETLEELVACGGDADTNASIAAQVMGATIGYNSIPQELIDRLPEPDGLASTAHRFADVVVSQSLAVPEPIDLD
ncbi:MAG: ADP-ribosylglycohydrolase family protein, partial [Blastocatellia bacterium]